MALAPADRATSRRVVLLTPGPLNETYFEHAYLARYLGFTLVEGARSHGARSAASSSRRSKACSRSTSSSAGSTTASAIRSSCAATRRSAWRAWWRRCAPATSRSPTRSARAWSRRPPMRRSCRVVPAPARRGAAAAVGRDRGGAASPTSCSTCSSISTSSSSSGRSRPRREQPVFGRKLSDRAEGAARGRRCWRARTTSSRRSEVALSTAPVWHRHRIGAAAARAARRTSRPPATRMSVMPGGLTRVSSTQRRADRVDAARRRQQGHLGAVGRTRERGDAAGAGAARRCGRSALEATCRAAWPRTCSGWAATPSAPSMRFGCCAASSRASRDEDTYRGSAASCRRCCTCWSTWRCSPSASRSACRCASSKRTCCRSSSRTNPHAGLPRRR